MRSSNTLVAGDYKIRPPIRQFLALFLPVAAVVLLAGFHYVNLRIDDQLQGFVKDERAHIYHVGGFIGAEVVNAVNTLRALVEEPIVRQVARSPGGAALPLLEDTLLALARRNPSFQQVRWISEKGREIVRVTRDKDELFVVPESGLQEKSDRYYVTATKRLTIGEFYVSRVDLNVEHGKIELPPRAMIRVATPVFDGQNQRRGILVINISANSMLEAVRQMHSSADDTRYFLVNQLGQQLVASQQVPSEYSAGDSDFDFSASHTAVWQQLSARPSGSIALSDGLWIWERFASAAMLRATGLSMGDLESSRIRADELSLALIAHKPLATILDLRQDNRLPVILGAFVLLSVYALSLFIFLRSLVVEQRAKLKASYAAAQAAEAERVKELQERFRRLVETSSIGQILIDDTGQIVMSNPAAEAMLGYEKEELNHRPVDQLVPPESQDQHARWRKDYLVSPESRKMGEGRELSAVTKDGKHIPVEIGLNPYVEEGKQFVLASIINLSKRGEKASTYSMT